MTNISIAIISLIVNIWLQSEAARLNKRTSRDTDDFPGSGHDLHRKQFRSFRYIVGRRNVFDFSLN